MHTSLNVKEKVVLILYLSVSHRFGIDTCNRFSVYCNYRFFYKMFLYFLMCIIKGKKKKQTGWILCVPEKDFLELDSKLHMLYSSVQPWKYESTHDGFRKPSSFFESYSNELHYSWGILILYNTRAGECARHNLHNKRTTAHCLGRLRGSKV
jgi:hypothetical protein